MTPELLLAFVLVFALDSVTPGPATAAVMARAATRGWRAGLPFVAGLVVGDLVLFALAVAGLAALAAAYAPAFALLKWAGAGYLLWLAWRTWHAPVATPTHVPRGAVPAGDGVRLFAAGVLLPLGNPKAVGFYVAILPTVLSAQALTAVPALVLAALIATIWGATLIGYAIGGERIAGMARRRNAIRWLNRSSAVALAGAAGAVATREA